MSKKDGNGLYRFTTLMDYGFSVRPSPPPPRPLLQRHIAWGKSWRIGEKWVFVRGEFPSLPSTYEIFKSNIKKTRVTIGSGDIVYKGVGLTMKQCQIGMLVYCGESFLYLIEHPPPPPPSYQCLFHFKCDLDMHKKNYVLFITAQRGFVLWFSSQPTFFIFFI